MSLFTGKNRLLAGTLLAGVAFGGFTAPANAQQSAPKPADNSANATVEVVVTGSRLRRESFDSPNPTVSVGAAEIETRQLANVADALEDIPLVGIGSNSRGTQTQNGDSFALPDVLDLGTQRTLTLLNGRRIQPTLPGTVFVPGNSSGSQVDLSTINPALISRVEVVAGTGGAIYGADAVGGVVNIITKDDYEGINLDFTTGVTEIGDGEQYRAAGLWGKNFLDGRANYTASVDYFKQDLIVTSTDTLSRYLGSGITSPYNGGVRNTAAFDAASAVTTLTGGGTLPSVFLGSGADGLSSIFFGPTSLANPLVSQGGTLVTRQQLNGIASTTQLVPNTPVAAALAAAGADPAGFAFFAPSALTTAQSNNPVPILTAFGLTSTQISSLTLARQQTLALQLLQRNRPTPLEYFQANPNLNPLLFAGTFAGSGTPNGYFPTITNTNPATAAIFPRIAVPLQFDGSGNLVAYNPGTLSPSLLGLVGSQFGGQGYDSTALGHAQVQAGTERVSFGGIGRFDITKNIRAKNELFYSKIKFEQMQGASTNGPTGSTTAGSLAIPIFIDQNPFVTSASLTTINNLAAQGATIPTLGTGPGAPRVLYMGRALTELTGGGITSTTETEGYRIAQIFEGDFKALGDRQFYWDAAAYYGRSETITLRPDVKDIEFALAVDVVQGPNGPVCRQQTLSAPESIALRNPGLPNIVNAQGLVPTAAQVAACKPLNLFGNGRASQDAINYVMANVESASINTLTVYSGSFNGDVVKLPAGWVQAGVQVETRTEAAEFEPDRTLQRGLTRTAQQFVGRGSRDFTEYGYEVTVPVFGKDFNFPMARELEFNYAFRQVEREQQSSTFAVQGRGTDDDTFNYSFRYKPVEDLTLRGAKSRTVRSASLVELFDPGIRAFGGVNNQSNPCATTNITLAPDPAVRRANCVSAIIAYGYATNQADALTFLSNFNPLGSTNRPATAAGNPFLANEQADAYTFGFTYEPEWAPRLTLAADFFSVDLRGELGLVGTPTTTNACFDSTAYPNSIVGASNPACDAILFNLPGPGGSFTVPTVNPLTGRTTILTQAYGGSPATVTGPFELAAIDFLNLNLAVRELRAVNLEARYNFDLKELPVVGGMLTDAGSIFLRGSVLHTQRYDIFTPTLNRVGAEHGNPEYKTRLDIRHKIGGFEQTLQWFWQSETWTDRLLSTPLVEQSPAFVAPDYNYFNYFASYQINDNFTARFVVNNLTDTEDPRGQFGVVNDFDGGLGREFLVGVSAKF